MIDTIRTRLAAALVALLAGCAPTLAQEGTAAAPANQTEEQDSGVGDIDTAGWVGKPVLSIDGETVGTLSEVRLASGDMDGGTLIVARENGEEATVPLQGASFDGASVTVGVPMETIRNPPAASVN